MKERLNLADANQQLKLYKAFKDEDFVHKIWDRNGPDHRNMDSERAHYNSSGPTASKNRKTTLTDKIGNMFLENQYDQKGPGGQSTLNVTTFNRNKTSLNLNNQSLDG